ncbi:YfhH family protein [Halobacillus rhizosphaerae]|uniref:YfhH family protein n=1 Tax=Halobacillus rhizosphaerae TaxID=3064889 RepID=UPI00398A64ED
MERRYSDFTHEELRQEIAELTEKAQKAEQLGMVNEFAVHERKIVMARSYMLDPNDFKAGETYEISGDPEHHFYVEYMNGIFAWGYRFLPNKERKSSGEEEALPISLLER